MKASSLPPPPSNESARSKRENIGTPSPACEGESLSRQARGRLGWGQILSCRYERTTFNRDTTGFSPLFDLDAVVLDDLPPLIDVGPDPGSENLRRSSKRFHTGFKKLPVNVRVFQNLHNLPAEQIDNAWRRFRRREKTDDRGVF